jgi:hypothetical protein
MQNHTVNYVARVRLDRRQSHTDTVLPVVCLDHTDTVLPVARHRDSSRSVDRCQLSDSTLKSSQS